MRNLPSSHLCSSECKIFGLCVLLVFSLSVALSNLPMMFFGIIVSMFLCVWCYWNSWICAFIVFLKLGTFSAIISWNIFFCFPSLLSYWNFNYTSFMLLEVIPLMLCSFLKISFLYFQVVSIAVPSSPLTFSSAVSNLLLIISVTFFLISDIVDFNLQRLIGI